ncbi:MAG: hypothetical protein HOC91_14100 [Nitrospinaceae bacterium]|jgi:2-dehydropantoate 2-reductase|nr:hypothetical protein [Nitrospinaceae bacterium]MBT3435829.1 hypothetical protein [Nitrospinaceae bacterium]MBT3822411.1 hypothetical protein [Nitrospinaceae bacterium]MBT4094118.1 hypothetical protein [Nitrospinaceae bacterium]MBT4431637.1 hypothetical protein [Nitrospinaceae bacterium]
MSKKIAVMGAGAIGSSVSADLTDAGLDVTVFDQWPAQVEAMKATGLHIVMPDLDLKTPMRAYHLCELASLKQEFDIVFVAVKSYDSRWMGELIAPYLKSDGVLVGLQNSMNDDTYVSVVGRERTVGCVIELSAQIFTPGEVQRNTTRTGTWFGLGELDGKVTPRVKELQEILSNVATVDLTENIYGARWTKLTVNSMAMGPFGVLGIKKTDVDDFEGMFELQVKLGKEAFAVASAVGYQIEPVFGLQEDDFAGSDEQVLVTALRTLQRHTGTKSQSASLQDSKKGRKNELEFINGMVSLRGKEVGVPTPCNDAVTEIARRINKGELKMERSNYDLLLKLASEG